MINQADLDNWFQYHPPNIEQLEKYEAIRSTGKSFAELVLALTPSGKDQSEAIRRIRDAVAVANAAVACSSEN